jgi:hypothetical protein
VFEIFFIMSCVLIYASAMATMVEVYVEELHVIVEEQPQVRLSSIRSHVGLFRYLIGPFLTIIPPSSFSFS